MNGKKILKFLGGAAALGAFGAVYFLEKRRPLRREVESKAIRNTRNLAVFSLAAVALQFVEKPIAEPLTKLVERKNVGLLKLVRLPRFLENLLAIILLDYTLYVWHVLTHRVEFLWRLHRVHHIDLDLDASTALRFHFGELIVSVAWRAAQIILIGVSPASFSAWQMFLIPSVLFHHSNLRLPEKFEKKLAHFIVTPNLHGIHHSIRHNETDSNWSSGLTIWDYLHGTLKTDVAQDAIIIGIPAYREMSEVGLTKILLLPFEKQKSSRQIPAHLR